MALEDKEITSPLPNDMQHMKEGSLTWEGLGGKLGSLHARNF